MFILHLPVPIPTLNGLTLRILTILMVYSLNALGSPLQNPEFYPPAEMNNNEDLLETNAGNIEADNLQTQTGNDRPPIDYLTYSQNTIDDENVLPTLNDNQLNLLTLYLTQVLTESWRDNELPLLYIEEHPSSTITLKEHINEKANHPHNVLEDSFVGNTAKRTRYYRKYPWKRQNSRSRMYNAENKYMCQPSREDVYQLLLALHESRSGNRNRTVNFCNRRRPAAAIYTNIRFLGRRRK